MNTHAVSSVSRTSVLGDRSALLRPRLPSRPARLASAPVAQAWKKDNDAARPAAKAFVQDSARLLASLAAAQLMALPFAGGALAQATPSPEGSSMGPNEVTAESIEKISAYASDEDKFSPGRSGTTFGDPAAAAKGDTSEATQFKKSAGDFSRNDSGGGAPDIGATPPSLVDKVKEVFGVSEAPVLAELAQATPSPEGTSMGPNEVTAESIEKISAYASDEDKFSPGRSGTTFGDPAAAAKGDTSEATQFKKSAGDFSRNDSGGGAPDIGNTPPNLKDKIKEVFGVSEVNPDAQNLGPNEVGQQAINRITPNASSFDKAAPGRSGSTFGDPAAAGQGQTGAQTQFAKAAGDATKDTLGKALGGESKTEASGGLLGRFKSIFNLSEMPGPDSKNPSPNDVTKDIASRLKTDGNKGFAELDVQSPGRSNNQQGGTKEVGSGFNSFKNAVKEGAEQASPESIGDKLREAIPGLSELPNAGDAVQAGKDLVGKLPSSSDVTGGAGGDKPDVLEKGIRGALAKAPDDLSNPKGAPYTKAASDAIKDKVGELTGQK